MFFLTTLSRAGLVDDGGEELLINIPGWVTRQHWADSNSLNAIPMLYFIFQYVLCYFLIQFGFGDALHIFEDASNTTLLVGFCICYFL